MKRWREAYKAEMKDTDFHKWKATQFRSNWRRRAKLHGISADHVPKVNEIIDWLDSQKPFTCFYTGEKLERDFGVDHIVSLARGGSFSLDNLCITNPFINGAKGSMTGDEFKALLELIRTWEDGGQEVLRRLRSAGTIFGGKK